MTMTGRHFWKMSGSGNDFVFFDARHDAPGDLASAKAIGAMCDRRTGIGADGVVFLEPHPSLAFTMHYYNRDGSLAEMCGNAALCSTRLARELGIAPQGDFAFQTVSGPVTGRFRNGLPAIDMVPVTETAESFETPLKGGERQIGYTRVGVPHLVVLVDDVAHVDVLARGGELRRLPQLRDGANANFVSPGRSGEWLVRTYERGVEDETLACGTGSVACASLLSRWKLAGTVVPLRTRSGRTLQVTLPTADSERPPELAGEGRIVFQGTLGELDIR